MKKKIGSDTNTEISFHLEFSLFWVSWSYDLGDLSDLKRGQGIFFQKLHFWNLHISRKKMRHVSAFSSKCSLNLSTEEVWLACWQNCHLNFDSKYCAGLLLRATQQSHCIRGLLVEKFHLPGPIKPSTLSTLTVNFECQSTPTYFHLFQRLFIRAEGNF